MAGEADIDGEQQLGTVAENESIHRGGEHLMSSIPITDIPREAEQYELSSEDYQDNQRNANKRKGKSKMKQPHSATKAKALRLRPAGDILNRIRWDPQLKSSEYLVGYVERFEGVKEMPVDLWIRELTDKGFIPQHRIKYFKTVSDGNIIWDREERIDEVFGSGLTSNIGNSAKKGAADGLLPVEREKGEPAV